jgi:hypothetical protein
MAYTSFVDDGAWDGALPLPSVAWWPRIAWRRPDFGQLRFGLFGAACIGVVAVAAALPFVALGTARVAGASLSTSGYDRAPTARHALMLTRPEMRPAATARLGEAMILSAAATPTTDMRLATATPTVGGDAAPPTHLAFAAPPPVADAEPRPEAAVALAAPVQQPPAPEPDLPQQALAFAAAPELESRQPAIPLPPAFSRPAPGLRGPAREDQAVSRPPARPMLASLPPADNLGDRGTSMLPGPGSGFALYDIEGHTVYMPNGERLEAHSGLGEHFDDPDSIARKNRGVTPPNTYDLRMRESLFHGVAAIRLTPVAGSQMFGRDGMLAHTYMLGPRGDSNGCVSFKDYPRFLNAFKRGEIRRLVGVKRLDAASSRIASAGKGKRFLWWNL